MMETTQTERRERRTRQGRGSGRGGAALASRRRRSAGRGPSAGLAAAAAGGNTSRSRSRSRSRSLGGLGGLVLLSAAAALVLTTSSSCLPAAAAAAATPVSTSAGFVALLSTKPPAHRRLSYRSLASLRRRPTAAGTAAVVMAMSRNTGEENNKVLLEQTTAAPQDDDDDDDDDESSLTPQERILRSAGLAPESSADRIARQTLRSESETKLKSDRRTNALVAAAAFAAALFNFAYRYSHPITPIQILSELQSNSAPVQLIGQNGKPTVVDFWAPWCENCKASAPTLAAIEKEYGNRVNFVLVNADVGSSWEMVERFGVDAIPHMALVGGEGDVETALIGPIPRSVLRADLDVLLENAAVMGGDGGGGGESAGAEGGSGGDSRLGLPYDVTTTTKTAASADEGADAAVVGREEGGGEGSAPTETAEMTKREGGKKKAELPYVMFDAFRNTPDLRRVRFD